MMVPEASEKASGAFLQQQTSFGPTFRGHPLSVRTAASPLLSPPAASSSGAKAFADIPSPPVRSLPPAAGSSSISPSRRRAPPSAFSSPGAPAADSPMCLPPGVCLSARRRVSPPSSSFRLSASRAEATAHQKELEQLILSSPKEAWPIAAKHFREELATLRKLKGLQQVKQNLAKQHRIQQCVHDEEQREEEEGKRQGRGQRSEATGRDLKAETEISDTEWTAEEVQLLWQGKTVSRKRRKPTKIDLIDQPSSWSLLQQQVQKLQRNFWRRLEWSSWWETGEEPEKRAEATIATTPEKQEEDTSNTFPTTEDETEEEDEKLPVFGLKSIHKKERLRSQVRPVWRPQEGPLRYNTGLPRNLVAASAAVAPPTRDEMRRLLFYFEEVKRREAEDATTFETAGELLRQRYWRLWKQLLHQQKQLHEKRKSKGGRKDGALSLSEGKGSQAEAEHVLEECLDQGVTPARYSKRTRKRRDTQFTHDTNEGQQNAIETFVESFIPPLSPPRWLLPSQKQLRQARIYGDWERAEFQDAIAAGGEVAAEETQGDRRSTDGTETTERIKQSIFPPGNERKRQLASPGGPLDEELVILKGPREGWRWTIEDRDRWKRSLLLRRAMKNNQVLFAADLEERQYAEDFERFMGKPFIPPRADWGGYAYYAAAFDEEDEETKGRTRAEERRRRGEEGDDCFETTARTGGGEDEAAVVREKAWREAFVAHVQQERRKQEALRKEADVAKQIGKLQRNEETRLEKLCEALEGNLPSPFDGAPFPARKKHPKNCIVPSDRLRAYGEMIDKLSNCPFLQVDMQQAVSDGWRYTRIHLADVKHVPIPRGVPPDKYFVTKEKLREAAVKLHVAEAEEPAEFALPRPQRAEHIQEPAKLLRGGRYAV